MIKHKSHLFIAIVISFVGLLFYANFRPTPLVFGLITDLTWLKFSLAPNVLPEFIQQSLPSMIFVLIMSLLTSSIIGLSGKKHTQIPLFWSLFACLFEGLQHFKTNFILFSGEFNLNDIYSILLACFIMLLAFKKQSRDSHLSHSPTKLSTSILFLTSTTLILGSYKDTSDDKCAYPDDVRRICYVTPLYLPWDELRNNDVVYFSNDNANAQTQTLVDNGALVREFSGLNNPAKIYVYQDYLFVNERYSGVYVFDNQNPQNPIYLAYIKVVGATDMEVKDDVMYINSFTDLVAVELTPPFNYQRSEDAFDYPSVDALLPSSVRLVEEIKTNNMEPHTVDQDKGILVGYQTNDDAKFFFWDIEI